MDAVADPREVRPHRLQIGVAAVGRFLERTVDDRRQRPIDSRNQGGERLGGLVQHLQENRLLGLSTEGLVVGEELVEHQPDRKNVTPVIGRLPDDLLRGHVVRRPHEHLALQRRVGVDPAGDAEIEDLQDPRVAADHQVRGLDVTVDDAVPVRVGEADADLLHQGDPPRQGQRRATVDELAEGLAGDELHRDERLILVGADVVDRNDVGVLEPGGQPGLAQEPLPQILAVDAQDLEGDLALGHWVERQIEHAHATVRNALTELVTADCRGWRGQCADYTHRSPRRPAASAKESISVFRRASVLLVTAFALGGCSRQATDAPAAPATAPGPVAVASVGDAAADPAAPASAGPAADGGSAEAAWNAAGRRQRRGRREGPVPLEGRGPRSRSTSSAPSTCPTTASWRCRRPS